MLFEAIKKVVDDLGKDVKEQADEEFQDCLENLMQENIRSTRKAFITRAIRDMLIKKYDLNLTGPYGEMAHTSMAILDAILEEAAKEVLDEYDKGGVK